MVTMKTVTKRCAIYTRKSHDEGLDQDYNSLDAQRDAGEAYIKSQQHEGWTLVKKHYDDPGFSGGNLERPALKELIKDIEAGLIDVIVVYKVDRLSRSLHDFAKLVEIFDRKGISFVSVTQSFNTTSSMGRLTLNILLSFAQFEREVTGERIRDKIKASVKKGIWMGGKLPLGYDVQSRKLIINQNEADQVRYIFKRYLELDSIYALLIELQNKQITHKKWETKNGKTTGGSQFSKSTIYTLLRNPVYIGKLSHKQEIYEGLHEAILSDDIWQTVQEKLACRSKERKTSRNNVRNFWLRKKLYDHQGMKFITTYTAKEKGNDKYFIRYYKATRDHKTGYKSSILGWINADEIERIVDLQFRENFKDTKDLYHQWDVIKPKQKDLFYKKALIKVTISTTQIVSEWNPKEIQAIRDLFTQREIDFYKANFKQETSIKSIMRQVLENKILCTLDYMYRNYGGKKVITDANGKNVAANKTYKNPALINAIISAHEYHEKVQNGEAKGVMDLAREFDRDRSYISKIIRLYNLSPKIKGMILDGKQPPYINVQSLLTISRSLNWVEQESLI